MFRGGDILLMGLTREVEALDGGRGGHQQQQRRGQLVEQPHGGGIGVVVVAMPSETRKIRRVLL